MEGHAVSSGHGSGTRKREIKGEQKGKKKEEERKNSSRRIRKSQYDQYHQGHLTNKQPFGCSRNLTESFLVGIIVYQSAMAVIILYNNHP